MSTENKIKVQLGIVNYCPSCGAPFAKPQPEENETEVYCPEDDGGCGSRYRVIKK